MVNVVIIGFGGMGEYHVHLMERVDKIQAYGAYDIDSKRLKVAQKKGLKIYNSPDEIAADKNVTAVLIATPNDLHCPYAEFFAKAKKHIICEKPAALSSDEFIRMVNTAKEENVVLTVHQNRRQDIDYVTVKNICEQGLLGKIYRIESRVLGANGIPGGWRKKPEHGGGMMLDWGVHLIDQIMGLSLGKIQSIQAQYSYTAGFSVEDGFSFSMVFSGQNSPYAFQNEVVVNIEVGTNSFINLPRWVVYGTDGTMHINDFDANGKMIIRKSDDEEPVAESKGNGLTKTMAKRPHSTVVEVPVIKCMPDSDRFYKNFVEVITKNAELYVRPEQVLKVLQIMEKAKLAADNATIIKEQ